MDFSEMFEQSVPKRDLESERSFADQITSLQELLAEPIGNRRFNVGDIVQQRKSVARYKYPDPLTGQPAIVVEVLEEGSRYEEKPGEGTVDFEDMIVAVADDKLGIMHFSVESFRFEAWPGAK